MSAISRCLRVPAGALEDVQEFGPVLQQRGRVLLLLASFVGALGCSSVPTNIERGPSIASKRISLPKGSPVTISQEPIIIPQSGLCYNILVDNGHAIKDPLLFDSKESVLEATKLIEVILFQEDIYRGKDLAVISKGLKSPSNVVADHLLYFITDPWDINVANQENTLLAYHEIIDQTTRRVRDIRKFEDWYRLKPEATQVPDPTVVNLPEFFISSRSGVPIPLKVGDIFAYLELTVIPVREGSHVNNKPVVVPIALQIVGEQRLFGTLDCFTASGAFPNGSATVSSYISKVDGVVVKSIIASSEEQWRVVKTAYR